MIDTPLLRYGRHADDSIRELPDGYWTPWHLAQAELAAKDAEIEKLREDSAALSRSIMRVKELEREIEKLRGGLLQCLQHWFLSDDPRELQETVKNLKALSGWEAALDAAKGKP